MEHGAIVDRAGDPFAALIAQPISGPLGLLLALAALLDRDEQGNVIRKLGIMGIILTGGTIQPGDPIRVELPPEPHRALDVV